MLSALPESYLEQKQGREAALEEQLCITGKVMFQNSGSLQFQIKLLCAFKPAVFCWR